MSNHALVLDTKYRQLSPCKPSVAQRLLDAGKAAVFRQYPFTIILKKEVDDIPEPCQLKIDPGSKTTGLAILQDNAVIWAAELTHRGQAISSSLTSRRQLRRGRRGRKTRYRQPRFLNRARPKGWLAPSLQHRVETTLTWVNRLRKLCSIGSIAQELVRFDLQKLENPEISGIEYQQGERLGYEVREYLLNKWNRQCTYCNAKDVPLQVEHIHPKAKGGSNRISNLCLACEPCNLAKGTQSIEEFLSGKPDLLKRVKAQAKRPLKDAAAVNSTRWALLNALKETGLPVSVGTGGQTKFNRSQQGLPKTHWLDAACVGDTPQLQILTTQPLLIKAMGYGCRQVIHVDKYGFPRRNKSGELVRKSALVKTVKGFQTGDIVRVVVPKGKYQGAHAGRVAIRSSGSFNIKTLTTLVRASWKYCTTIQQKDGYTYAF